MIPMPSPDGPPTLRQLLCEALAEIERRHLRIADLEHARFGRRSDQLSEEELQRTSEELEQSLAEQSAKPGTVAAALARGRPTAPKPPRRNHGALPAHLPRVETIVDVEKKSCPCRGKPLHVIGEDRVEMLDYVPARFWVRVIRGQRYGCRAREGAVVQALAPVRPIDGGIATEALLAHVLVSKHADR